MKVLLLSILPAVAPVLSEAMDDGPWGKVTLVGALIAAVLAYQKRWIVPGPLYDDLRKQNEELRQANEQLRRLVHDATGTAVKALDAQPPETREGG